MLRLGFQIDGVARGSKARAGTLATLHGEVRTPHPMASLHYLIKEGDLLGWQLLSTHNLTFYHRVMREIRRAILDGRFRSLYSRLREILAHSDGGEKRPEILDH